MNGRCETDPFDQAIDVCSSCYGEFCQACLIRTKGRKHPLCRECTIVASGLRVGAKPAVRGDKRTADERRKVLKAAPIEQKFQYFDMNPASETSVGSPADGSPLLVGDADLADDAPTDESTATVAPVLDRSAPEHPASGEQASVSEEVAASEDMASPARSNTSAIDQLGFIRETGAAPRQAHGAGGEADAQVHRPSVADHPAIGSEDPWADEGDDPLADDGDEFRPPRPFIKDRTARRPLTPAPATSASGTERGEQPEAGSDHGAGAGPAPIAAIAALTREPQSTAPAPVKPEPEPPTTAPAPQQPPPRQTPSQQASTPQPSPAAGGGPNTGSIRPTPPADPAPLPRRRQRDNELTAMPTAATSSPANPREPEPTDTGDPPDSAEPPAWTLRPVAERPRRIEEPGVRPG